jgi:uncharacterized protein DUF4179/uncharacterized protein DUF5643
VNSNDTNINDYSIEKFEATCSNAKEKFDDIRIPDKLDKVIESAVDRAYRNKKLKFIKPITTVAACVFMFIFIVNVSPTFATYLSEIPGFETLIKIISFDKGLTDSVEHGYAQKINKSCKNKDIEFSIDDIIFDKRSLIITYSIKTKEEYDWLVVKNFEMFDDKKNKVSYPSHRPIYNDSESNNINKGIMEFDYFKNTNYVPSKLKFQCSSLQGRKISENNMEIIDGEWNVEFEIDGSMIKYAEPKVYNIDKKIEFDKININFEYMKIYPTSIDIKYFVDTDGDYICEGFKDMYIEDNKGNKYRHTGGTEMKTDSGILTFEGNYFENPKALTLKCDGVYLKPREDEYIVVDLENKKVIDDCGYGFEYLYHRNEEYSSMGPEISNEECLSMGLKISNEQISKLNESNFIWITCVEDINGNRYKIITNGESNDYENRKSLFPEIEKIDPLPKILKLKLGGIYKEITEPFKIKLY